MTIHPGFPAGGPEAGLDHATLLAALPELSRARVLVVGDAMLDRYRLWLRPAHQPRGADPDRLASSAR